MNKRQRKKLDAKLFTAIRELNNDVAIDEGFPLITDESVREILNFVKKSKGYVNQTLNGYKRFISNTQ